MNGKNLLFAVVPFCCIVLFSCFSSDVPDYRIKPVGFNEVQVSDSFWTPKIDINRRITIPFGFKMSEETGRIDNFAIAAGMKEGEFCSRFPFDDSDVYKIIEGASYSLSQHYDAGLDLYLDSLIYKISKAQMPDGYLQTWRIIDPQKPGDDWWGESEPWTGIRHGHELYNAGHLYEAAVAHFKATGKRSLLDVAIKNADLVAAIFGPDKKIAVPGHEEIEIGLIKLYRTTGERKYLHLASFFVEQRGIDEKRELLGEYHQDHMPVRQQRTAVGHAVRAGYLYSAMADLAAITGDNSYLPALEAIWEDIVQGKTYVTGGIGAKRSGESFGEPYELPNATAYAETCAAIASVLWNHRMFLLSGEGRYYDVLERTLYNGLISGVSFGGDRFFYPNPLESDGETSFNYGSATRQKWFPCACCPSNISRFMPSVPGYVYAVNSDTVYVNLFISSHVELSIKGEKITVGQETEYPWQGKINLLIDPDKAIDFVLALRIPGWAVNEPIPGDLYRFTAENKEDPMLRVNHLELRTERKNGYFYINRSWEKDDVVSLELPMRIQKVKAHPEVVEDRGKIALQRGPLVYCFEQTDNEKDIGLLKLNREDKLNVRRVELFGGINGIRVISGPDTWKAIPYFLWSNRGPGKMRVWVNGLNP